MLNKNRIFSTSKKPQIVVQEYFGAHDSKIVAIFDFEFNTEKENSFKPIELKLNDD